MVERVGEFLGASPLVAPTGALAVVAAEGDEASKVIAFRVVGSGGVDGDGARLRHDELAPRVQGGLETDGEDGRKVDQFNGATFGDAVAGRIANFEREHVDAVAEAASESIVAVGNERQTIGRPGPCLPRARARSEDVAIKTAGPREGQFIVVQVPRIGGVEHDLSLRREDGLVLGRGPIQERCLIVEGQKTGDNTVLVKCRAG